MILGLDISTSAIGVAVLSEDESVVLSHAIKYKSEQSLEERAVAFQSYLEHVKNNYSIDNVFVEEPAIMFNNNSTAKTMAILQRFNGMCCFIVHSIFGKSAKLLNVRSIRARLKIKIPKGVKNKNQKKQPIIDFVESKYKNTDTPFLYEMTKFGNFKPTTDDRADAIILALAGPKMS